jgi:hypothetical protein
VDVVTKAPGSSTSLKELTVMNPKPSAAKSLVDLGRRQITHYNAVFRMKLIERELGF